MAGELSPEELDSLLGAYSLDAVEPEERAELEQYLAQNPAARAEVDDTRELISLLVDLEEGSPGLWNRIQEEIRGPDAAREAASSSAPTPRQRRPVSGRAVVVAAAAAAVFVAVVGVVALREDGASGGDRIAEAADAAQNDPAAREAALADRDGVARAAVVYLPDGTGYVRNLALADLPPGRTYQLWAVVDDTVVSAGVLGPDVDVVAFHYDGPVRAFAISTEDAPGARTPHEPVTAEGALA
ncbi:MAG TPA: anti-sigma factor [Acidimicrobiia bacterium]